MARKPKERKVPIVNKDYIWELDVDGELHEFKVFVGENECITYADGVECKRLKIMDKRQMEGLLQIDTQTRVLDEVTGFQLENGIPYIKIENEDGDLRWCMSDTTREDRLQEKVRILKKEAYGYALIGVFFFIAMFIERAITGSFGEWPIWPVLGVTCFSGCAFQLVRLRNELEAMGRPFSLKL